MQWIMKLAAMAGTIYLAIVLAAWLGQRHLMYVPNVAHVAPASLGLQGVREQLLNTPDGARLVSWRSPAQPGQPTMLYFHGNAGNLASRADRFQRYQRLGLGVMMVSYRGYSGSTGRPSEAHNVADANLAYDVLLKEGLSPDNLVVFGESLGSGVAIQLAAKRRIAALILDAPYTSIVDVALLNYPYLPVRPLLIDRYESDKHIRGVKVPVLVLHGERDSIIPVRMGRAIYGLAPEPKRLALFPDGGHVNLDEHGAVKVVAEWLAEIGLRPRT